MKRFVLIIFLLFPLSLWAAPDGRVRISFDSDKTWWVGQRVPVYLELLTNGYSFSSQQFSSPQIEGGVMLQTDSTTVKLSEQIEGESWQILRYDLSLFVQRQGDIQVPSFNVRFGTSMGYGQPVVEFDLMTEALTLPIAMPPGADVSKPVVTSSQMSIKEIWQPDKESFVAGDALTRTVTIDAQDVSGIALPPLPRPEIEGIDQLASAPLVKDKSYRGDLTGHREEQVSYLFKQAGNYQLPGAMISWWNPNDSRLETYELPARMVEVAPNPLMESEATGAQPSSPFNLRLIALAGVVLAVVLAFIYWRWPHWQASRKRRQRAEPAVFKRAIRACRASDQVRAWRDVNAWLSLSELSIQGKGQHAWETLQRALVSGDGRWSGRELADILTQMRRSMRLRQRAREQVALNPLNPLS